RALSRSVAADCARARWTPTTSWPASIIRAAATAESTPPLIAATTLMRPPPGVCGSRPAPGGGVGTTGALERRRQGGEKGVDVGPLRAVPEGEPQRTPCLGLRHAHRQQHVAGARDAGLARRAGRAGDARRVEQVEQRVALAVGHAQVDVARQAAG